MQVLLEVGQAWEAVQSASKAVQASPDWPEAHLTLGRAQLALGEVCFDRFNATSADSARHFDAPAQNLVTFIVHGICSERSAVLSLSIHNVNCTIIKSEAGKRKREDIVPLYYLSKVCLSSLKQH